MKPTVLGISGSPVPNSNTDRAVNAVLKATGLDSEFVKLSDLNIRPCRACKQCVSDNTCKQQDDFPELSKKLLKVDALVLGAYNPYSNIDAYTKAFLERLWSLRHVKNFLKNKPVVIIVTGVSPDFMQKPVLRYTGISKLATRLVLPADKVKRNLIHELKMDRMKIVGHITLKGNVPCLTCGHGNSCEMSGVSFLHGKNARDTSEKCVGIEDQPKTWKKFQQLGKQLSQTVSNKTN